MGTLSTQALSAVRRTPGQALRRHLMAVGWLLAAAAGFHCAVVRAAEPPAGQVRSAHPMFVGNRHFSDDRLSDLILLQPGELVSRPTIPSYEERVVTVYRDAGFPMVAARADIEESELTFRVTEGPRVAVEHIVFEGNKHVADKELRRYVASRRRGWPAFMRPGWFNNSTFQDDVLSVKGAYLQWGYLNAECGGHLTYNEAKTRVTLHVLIDEGPLYRVGAVVFEGNSLYRDSELLAATPFVVGEPYRSDDLDKAVQGISRLYAGIGHADVTAARDNLRAVRILPEEGTDVTVRVTINEGEQVRIGLIRIEGLEKTRENVVRRNLTFYPGQVATLDRFEKSERVLRNTGYFDNTERNPVQIALAPGDELVRDVIVRVKEGSTASIMLMAGYGEEQGFFGEFSLNQENFDLFNWPSSWDDLFRGNALSGGGQKLSLVLRAGTERSYYSLSLTEPAVGDGDYSLGFKLYSSGWTRDQFNETRTGFSVTGGKSLSRFVRHSVTVGRETIDVDDIADDAPDEIVRDDGSHSKPFVRYAAEVDRRDYRIEPTGGYLLRADVELGAGDVETLRVDLRGEKYWTVHEEEDGDRHVLALRGRMGMVDAYSGSRVPVFDRYFIGGIRTLRGFAYEGVAPIDEATEERLGGESMLVGSAEYSMPIGAAEDMRLLFFMDAGYVEEDATDVLAGWDELRASLGTGIRWHVPMLGPVIIEVNLGFPIMDESGDDRQTFHFSVRTARYF